jgi:4-nitrophenyl phosphatase
MTSDPQLDAIQAFILDMDGVFWRGDSLIPGATAFMDELTMRRLPYMFVTNNATSTPNQISLRAKSHGISVSPDQILTSSQAALLLLQGKLPRDAKMFMIGESGLRNALQSGGFELLSSGEGADAVVVGLDRKVSWEALSEAVYAIASGALFVGTNSDASFPTERGFAPGNGAILAAIEKTTAVSPLVVGKPEPTLFLEAGAILGIEPKNTLVVGDRLETDIAGGQRAGMVTALVLTGVTAREHLKNSSVNPSFVFEDLAQLSDRLWS